MRYSLFLVCVLLAAEAGSAAAQRRTITGRVTDESSRSPISGAQIVIKGTNTGTLGKADGSFALQVPAGDAVLQVSFIGYKRAEIRVGAEQTSVQVPMRVDVLQVDEIVVTGQATGMQRRNLANAVAKVNAAELVRAAPAASIEQTLSGKLSGADIQSRSGAPGGGVTVRLRGVTSITGASTPLYVLDGVVMSDVAIPPGLNPVTKASTGTAIGTNAENPVNRVADLNPDDIESIEVLKGASAAAIYGSKASNGVILITTKRGKIGAPQFSATQRLGFFEITQRYTPRRFETLEEATAAFGARASQFWAPNAYYDHDDLLSGNKPLSHETSFGVSGGSETTRYFASVLNKHDGGIVTGTYYDKQSLRVNLDQLVGQRITFSLNSDITRSASGRGLTGNDNSGTSYYYTLPYTPSFVNLTQNEDGTYPINPFYSSNPLQTAALLKNDEIVWRVVPSAKLSYEALNTAKHTVKLIAAGGIDFFNQKNVVFSPPELQFEADDGLPGTSVLSYSQNLNVNLNANAVYSYKPTAAISATTSFGAQYETRDLDTSRTLARNLIGGLQVVGAGTSIGVEEQHTRVQDYGIYGQGEVLLSERLLLTVGGRFDASSNNGDPKALFFYPKAATSYRLPLQLGPVGELKLRAAVGQSGNQPLYGQKFTQLSAINVSGIPGFFVNTQAGVSDVKPERQREIEGGLDAELFDSRATFELTAYEKRITDLLLQRNLPSSQGFLTQIFNGGVMRTRGIETALSVVAVDKPQFRWTSRANLFLTRCTIMELPVPTFRTQGLQIEAGKSCTQATGRDTLANGSSVTAVIGDAAPDYKLGFSNDFQVRMFKLYFLWDRQKGGLVTDGTLREFDGGQTSGDYEIIEENGRMRGLNRYTLGNRIWSVYTQDASYWKLREATLTVDVPTGIVHSVWGGARYVRLNLAGRNILTITDFTGGEPEQGSLNQIQGTGTNFVKYPANRSFWFSVDVGF